MDIGISEALRGVASATRGSALGSIARKFANKIESGHSKGAIEFPTTKEVLNKALGIKTASAKESGPISFAEASKKSNLETGYKGNAPTIEGKSGGSSSSASNKNSELSKMIGAGWDDAGDVISSTGKALQTSKNYISNLGKVKDQYLRANDKYKADTDTAIEGNKTLIEKNQREELDDLAHDTRKSVDNTNVMLGIKGASGGSAAKAASRAISEMAGKKRAETLTMRGNEMSGQNQEQENAKAEYELRRQKAYDWEKTAREQAIIDWASDSEALSRLKKNTGKWKDQDIKAESDRNLSKLLNNLAEISGRAKTFRETLAARMAEFGGSADELESAAINVDAPAELMTPDFNENIDLNNPEGGEDFFDPKKVGKRVIKGYDSLGNPIYEDELALANA